MQSAIGNRQAGRIGSVISTVMLTPGLLGGWAWAANAACREFVIPQPCQLAICACSGSGSGCGAFETSYIRCSEPLFSECPGADSGKNWKNQVVVDEDGCGVYEYLSTNDVACVWIEKADLCICASAPPPGIQWRQNEILSPCSRIIPIVCPS